MAVSTNKSWQRIWDDNFDFYRPEKGVYKAKWILGIIGIMIVQLYTHTAVQLV